MLSPAGLLWWAALSTAGVGLEPADTGGPEPIGWLEVPFSAAAEPLVRPEPSSFALASLLVDQPAEPFPQYDSRSQRPGSPTRRGPSIPEPLVFDLVRPLGAAVGEVEINTLGLFGGKHTSWAPEVEAVLFENFALELELPFENSEVESYKVAAQYTLGTGLDESFIHGLQGIVEHVRASDVTETTLVHIGALRFDETWSSLWMLGGRAHLGGSYDDARADLIVNASLFADLARHLVLGLETNLAQPLGSGDTELRVMPQAHVGLSEQLHLQAGYGLRWMGSSSRGEAGLRLIWSF